MRVEYTTGVGCKLGARGMWLVLERVQESTHDKEHFIPVWTQFIKVSPDDASVDAIYMWFAYRDDIDIHWET